METNSKANEPAGSSHAPSKKPDANGAAGSADSAKIPNNHNQQPHRGNRGEGRGRGRGKDRGRGRNRNNEEGGRKRRGDMGRAEWSRNQVDRRTRNDEEQAAKRRRIEELGEDSVPALPFTKEEIEGEERKPKRKVAVMIGYAGSGYKGMQVNASEKTIEGDIFAAFVAAGAISKANADDPKKSSLVRCARTDKGVHAAGNVISLKMIVEDPDIVQKINDNLVPQIRIWGIERTSGSFSCYQTCDSRWYEYLIPTHSFLPPHPQSFLGKKLVDSAHETGSFEDYQARQEEVASFWEETEKNYIKPILESLDPKLREKVEAAMEGLQSDEDTADSKQSTSEAASSSTETTRDDLQKSDAAETPSSFKNGTSANNALSTSGHVETDTEGISAAGQDDTADIAINEEKFKPQLTPLELALKNIKNATMAAKKAYRISPTRLRRVASALNLYLGTCNFHNYTILKPFKDPSAKRVIKSFEASRKPILIGDTEWISLKVHGQSFMMHQIRKMVAMVALVVRCGCPSTIIQESYGPDKISIPKAPGLGLLLERPVFNNYNEKAVKELGREKIDFTKHKDAIEEFKQREIYERIFREEEKEHQFHTFFTHIDTFRTQSFLWLTSAGISAAKHNSRKDDAASKELQMLAAESDDDVDVAGGEG